MHTVISPRHVSENNASANLLNHLYQSRLLLLSLLSSIISQVLITICICLHNICPHFNMQQYCYLQVKNIVFSDPNLLFQLFKFRQFYISGDIWPHNHYPWAVTAICQLHAEILTTKLYSACSISYQKGTFQQIKEVWQLLHRTAKNVPHFLFSILLLWGSNNSENFYAPMPQKLGLETNKN